MFAQLERETIQKRVTDAYYSRSQRGFKMGGKAPYGFHTVSYTHLETPIFSASSDLCNGNHITQKELAEKIGVSASQLSRIVSGETRTVSSDILIGVAKEFKVSTDLSLIHI